MEKKEKSKKYLLENPDLLEEIIRLRFDLFHLVPLGGLRFELEDIEGTEIPVLKIIFPSGYNYLDVESRMEDIESLESYKNLVEKGVIIEPLYEEKVRRRNGKKWNPPIDFDNEKFKLDDDELDDLFK